MVILGPVIGVGLVEVADPAVGKVTGFEPVGAGFEVLEKIPVNAIISTRRIPPPSSQ